MNSNASADRDPTTAIGTVLSVQGSQADIGLSSTSGGKGGSWPATVGNFVGIQIPGSLLVGVITDVSVDVPIIARENGCRARACMDLMGELNHAGRGAAFKRGVLRYPCIGNPAFLLSHAELQTIYGSESAGTIEVGRLQQDPSVIARVNVKE